jgi:hypothetical protein
MGLKQRIGLLLVGVLMASSLAHAAERWHTSKVQFVYPQGDGSFILGLVQNNVSCLSAATPTQYFYIVAGQNGVSSDGLKQMFAAALAAYATGSVLTVVFDDSTAFCYINRLTISEPGS